MQEITIVDVAKKANVSVSTASRALRDHPDISEKTKERVKDIAKELRYQPNRNAQNLRNVDTRTIVVLIKGISNGFYTPIIDALNSGLNQHNYHLLIEGTDHIDDQLKYAQQVILTRRPNGIIFLGGNYYGRADELEELPIPFVLSAFESSYDLNRKYSHGGVIFGNDKMASYDLTRYLIEKDHRHIAIVLTESAPRISANRLEGYKEALKDADIPFDPELVYYIGEDDEDNYISIENGYRTAKKIVEQGALPFTAVEGISDSVAFGICRAFREYGYRIPEDVAVTGLDGLPLALYATPSITTATFNIRTAGQLTLEMMLDLLNNKEVENVNLTYDLFKGETV